MAFRFKQPHFYNNHDAKTSHWYQWFWNKPLISVMLLQATDLSDAVASHWFQGCCNKPLISVILKQALWSQWSIIAGLRDGSRDGGLPCGQEQVPEGQPVPGKIQLWTHLIFVPNNNNFYYFFFHWSILSWFLSCWIHCDVFSTIKWYTLSQLFYC